MYRGARCFFQSATSLRDAFTVYNPVCLGPYERGLCDYSMCVCRGVEWGVVIRWVWSSATALAFTLCLGDVACPFAVLRDIRVWRVGGVQPTIIYFSGHRGAWIIIVNGP